MHRFLAGQTVNMKEDSGIVKSKSGARTIKSFLTEVILGLIIMPVLNRSIKA